MRGRVEIAEPRLPGLVLAGDEVLGRAQELFVHGFHARLAQRARVLDHLRADATERRILGGVVGVGRLAAQHAARPESFQEPEIFRIVRILGFLLGVEVIQVAEEFVEAVHRRQMFVAIAEVVLAELTGGVAILLHHVGWIFRSQSQRRARQPDLRQAGANWRLASDERRSPGGAALLSVPVGECCAFVAGIQ
jgi:hypothetical protein